MLNRIHVLFALSAGLTSCLATACDAPDDEAMDASEVTEAAAQALSTGAAGEALPPTKQRARDWMRWALEQPWSTGPVNDPTGASCASGQEGPTWFLAGTTGGSVTRECTIPAGKKLFFPLVNAWCGYPAEFYPDEQSIKNAAELNAAWVEDVLGDICSLTLRIDGEDVFAGGMDEMVEELQVMIPKTFEIELGEDNLYSTYGVAGGPTELNGGGYFARLKPLSPGDHVLELGGTICDGDAVFFQTGATYTLHVEE